MFIKCSFLASVVLPEPLYPIIEIFILNLRIRFVLKHNDDLIFLSEIFGVAEC